MQLDTPSTVGARVGTPQADADYSSGIDDEGFESLLAQVRELHRRADEITRETHRLHTNVRARLAWDRQPPPLPTEQREIADQAVDALSTRRLTAAQARMLHRTFFGR
jgi:hypothetical protein